MGFRINTGSGIDPKMVEQLMELERAPVKRIQDRRENVVNERKEFSELTKLVNELEGSLNSLRTRSDFYRLKVDSSHPDIIDGTADHNIVPGSYEVELLSMARSHKLLAESFPDKDSTPVGFGYMLIELEDGRYFDVEIDPDRSTLSEVAASINDADAGVRAIVMNTKEYLEDRELESYRLLVISERSGKEAKVYIDPDTTYLEFKEQVTGRNLEMLFEDVMVYDEDNLVDELLPGLTLNAKRAEPGTKIQLDISYDVPATMELIKGFVDKYNAVSDFINQQFTVDPVSGQAGNLARESALRTVRRALQGAVQYQGNGEIQNLAQMGITTDPKTGALRMDETKVSQALTENYVEATKVFIQSADGLGLGAKLSDAVRALQARGSGALASKEREYTRIIERLEDDIVRKERLAEQRAQGVKRRFTALEQLVSGLNAQGDYLRARLGGASSSPGGG